MSPLLGPVIPFTWFVCVCVCVCAHVCVCVCVHLSMTTTESMRVLPAHLIKLAWCSGLNEPSGYIDLLSVIIEIHTGHVVHDGPHHTILTSMLLILRGGGGYMLTKLIVFYIICITISSIFAPETIYSPEDEYTNVFHHEVRPYRL